MTEPLPVHFRECADRVPNEPCICEELRAHWEPQSQPMSIQQPKGWRDVLRVLDDCRSGEIESPEQLAEALSMHGFNFLIRHRLDAIYPADLFEAEQYGVNWGGEHAGTDIEPGARYITLLRMALNELGEDYLVEMGPSR